MSARDKLIEWFAPLLPEYYKTPEHESEAWAILLALATTHDVYTYLKRGRNQYPPFSNYLWKFLSFLNVLCLVLGNAELRLNAALMRPTHKTMRRCSGRIFPFQYEKSFQKSLCALDSPDIQLSSCFDTNSESSVETRQKLETALMSTRHKQRFERRFFLEHGWEPGVEEISVGTGLSEDAVLRTKELSYWIYTAVIFEDTSEIETKRLYTSVPTS